MKENPISTERGRVDVGSAFSIAEVVVRAVVGFGEEIASDSFKPKAKPVQKSSESLGDLMRIVAVRSQLRALMSEGNPQIGQVIHEPISSAVTQTVVPQSE